MQGITSAEGSPAWIPEKPVSAQQLIELGLKHLSGPLDRQATHVALPEYSSAQALVFLGLSHLSHLKKSPSILIVDRSLAEQSQQAAAAAPLATILTCDHLKQAMTKVLPLFDFKRSQVSKDEIPLSERVFVAKTAKLGRNVQLSPFAVIEEGAVIEEDVYVGPGAVIEAGAYIGKGTQIHANVVIGHHCRIGRNCIVNANTTIGSDGFGYLPNPKGATQKIPQIGVVIVEDNVEFGGNCAIDRATIGATLIQEGCKFDNLCHVAHNCVLGPQGLYAGNFSVAGSSKIGSHFMCGGHVAVADHITITDHVALGGRSAVTKDITEPGAYTGYPLEPMKEGLKTLANLRELTRMRKDIAQIKKHLGLEKE